MDKKQSLFTRDFILCTMICFFFTVFFFMFYTGMSSFSKEHLGADTATAGLTASIFIFGDLLSRLVFAGKMNYYGKKRMINCFLAAGTVMSLFYFVVGSVQEVCILRFIHGFTYGGMATAVNTLVAESLPMGRRGEGMSYFMLSMSVGSALGPFVCMYLQGSDSYSIIFAIGLVTTLCALVVSLFLTDDRKGRTSAPAVKNVGYYERSALPLSIVAFVFFFSYSGVLSFISPYGNDIGLYKYAVFFFVALSCGTLICRLFLGRIYDQYGENLALVPMFLLFVVGMLFIATARNGFVLLFGGMLIGFNIAQLNSIGQVIVIRESKPEKIGVSVSMFSLFIDLAYAVGAIVNGGIIDLLGYRGNYLLMAGIGFLSLVLYLGLHGLRHRGKPAN